MTQELNPPLSARDGRRLQVLLICRVSNPGPGRQDEKSLDDQEAEFRKWVEEHTHLPFDVKVIAGTGSGECLDREEVEQAKTELETGKYDLVIAEDLGRIFRRVHALLFCEAAEDMETRVIAPNDFVDTAQENWRLCAFFAALRHEMYNADTAKRIRRTLRNRFTQGGIFQCPIYGYIKPPGKKRDEDVQKDPDAQPIYDEWFSKLEAGDTFAEVADWLNEQGIPTGPYARKEKWDGRMVGRVTRNPILKGLRVRNDRITKRVNKTGRRKTVKAPPEERLERECPHLAFIEPVRYDRVIHMLKERNGKYRRRGRDGCDVRQNVPKKRTRFPGQTIYCGICGRGYVFGGHGQTDHLMCNGAREHKCWNGITVDGPLAAQKISEAVFQEIESLEGFHEAFLDMVQEQARQANHERDTKLRDLSVAITRNERDLTNVAKFVRDGDHSQTIRDDLDRLEREKSQLEYARGKLETRPVNNVVIPAAEELRQLARDEFKGLALDSFEFAKLMRCLVPKIVVRPYRSCDGGHIVLRSQFRLYLAGLLPDPLARDVLAKPLERILTVDLFAPCQRVAFREQIVALRATINPGTGREYTEAEAAREVGITTTAAQRAAALQRKMDQLGVSDPFVPVLAPPDDYTKLRRHKHKRYSFEPLEGAGQL